MKRTESLETDKLSEFDRLIPKAGLLILPGILYVDVNDVSADERIASRRMFRDDPEYGPLYRNRNEIWKGGNDLGRRFCSYVYKDGACIGNIVYTEKLDNPHGYGKNDFHLTKWIHTPYRRTKYSRYASGDLNHMLFISGIANRIYTYIKLLGEDTKEGLWTMVDRSQPCIGMLYSTDGPAVQKYVFLRKKFTVPSGRYAVMELNGDIYRSMDIVEYLLAGGPNRTRKDMEAMRDCMNNAAEVVKQSVGGAISE